MHRRIHGPSYPTQDTLPETTHKRNTPCRCMATNSRLRNIVGSCSHGARMDQNGATGTGIRQLRQRVSLSGYRRRRPDTVMSRNRGMQTSHRIARQERMEQAGRSARTNMNALERAGCGRAAQSTEFDTTPQCTMRHSESAGQTGRRPETREARSETREARSETRDPRPKTRDPRPESQDRGSAVNKDKRGQSCRTASPLFASHLVLSCHPLPVPDNDVVR
jgi:hypothetical protein